MHVFADTVLVIAAVALYFLPSIIAVSRWRSAPSPGSVMIVNWLLGWTVVGWIVALAMAVRSRRPQGPTA